MGCENLLVNEEVSEDQRTVFNLFWEDFDRNYAGFIVRNVDWDSIQGSVLGQIEAGVTEQEFFALLGEVASSFEDIHVEIVDHRGQRIRYSPVNPNSLSHIGPLNNYLESVRQQSPLFVYGKVANEAMGYISIRTFSSRFDLEEFEAIDQIMNELHGMEGLILDLRNNGGGEASSQKLVARRFVNRSFNYIQARFRDGPNHTDFDAAITDDISPVETGGFTGPIVILTNRSTESSAELFVMTLERQDYVTIVGDRTAGGLGLNTWRELPNGWNYRMTLTNTANESGETFEFVGIPPDEVVLFSQQDSITGIDPQLNRAIELLR